MKEFLVIKNYKVMNPIVDASLMMKTMQSGMRSYVNFATVESIVLQSSLSNVMRAV